MRRNQLFVSHKATKNGDESPHSKFYKIVSMKRIGLLLLCAFCISSLLSQSVCKTLFVGNSYTSVNDLPLMVSKAALSAGDTLVYDSSAPGGYTFSQHVSYGGTTSLIQAGGWDFVVLQEQSQYPAFPIQQVQAEVLPYATQLSDMIRAGNPNGEVMFYMTWGRKNGDADNCASYPPLCTYEGMDSLLYHRYLLMAEQNHAAVSPVGAVWHYLRDNHPEIELYNSDESHPSLAGSYAAAAIFYTVLFKKNPTLITDDLNLSAEVAQTIREAAKTVVFDSLDHWFQYVMTSVSEHDLNNNLHIFPNPCDDYIDIQSPYFQNNSGILTIYNGVGMKVKQLKFSANGTVRISTSDLPAGYYIMELDSNQISQRKPFIKR